MLLHERSLLAQRHHAQQHQREADDGQVAGAAAGERELGDRRGRIRHDREVDVAIARVGDRVALEVEQVDHDTPVSGRDRREGPGGFRTRIEHATLDVVLRRLEDDVPHDDVVRVVQDNLDVNRTVDDVGAIGVLHRRVGAVDHVTLDGRSVPGRNSCLLPGRNGRVGLGHGVHGGRRVGHRGDGRGHDHEHGGQEAADELAHMLALPFGRFYLI